MDGRRRKKQPQKQNLKNPQTKIKELKRDIETFETEVNLLLEHVPAASIDMICIVCQKTNMTDYHNLYCEHVICETCGNDQIRKHVSVHCPKCCQEKDIFHVRSMESSSSEDG